jgi:chaperone modulatory protein CbpM
MIARGFEIVLRRNEREQLTLHEVAFHAGMHPKLVERFVACGLVTPIEQEGTQLLFDPSAISRLRKVARLRNALGVNLAGISVILDLIDKLSAVQRENEALRTRS